jgi:hypothetical protein
MMRSGLNWCPGPESNRHGVAPEGFSYSLRLSPLRLFQAYLESGLYLCRSAGAARTWRLRQGPSSLYTFPAPVRAHLRERATVEA